MDGTHKNKQSFLKSSVPRFWLLSLFLIVILSLAIFLHHFLNQYEQQLTDDYLKNVRNSIEVNFDIWIQERFEDIQYCANSDKVKTAVKELLLSEKSKSLLVQHSSQKKLRAFFNDFFRLHNYQGFFIIAPDYLSIGSLRDENLGTQNLIYTQAPELINDVFLGKTRFIPPMKSDVPLKNQNGDLIQHYPTMFVATPVKDDTGKIIAALTLRINVYELYQKILRSGFFGESGETCLSNAEGTLLTRTRLKEVFESCNLANSQEIKSDKGVSFIDYRGKEVVSVHKWIQPYGIRITTKIDKDEVHLYSEKARLYLLLILAAIIIFFFTTVSFLIFYRKRHEIFLLKSEYSLNKSQEIAQMVSWEWDFIDNQVYCSKAFFKLTGLLETEKISFQTLLQMIHPDDQTHFKDSVELAINRKTSFLLESRLLIKNQDYVTIINQGTFYEANQIRSLFGIFQDISKIKSIEQNLEEKKEQAELLLSHTSEAIFGIDREGICTFANASCASILGYDSTDELIGQNMHLLIHNHSKNSPQDKNSECKILKSMRSLEACHIENETFQKKDGTYLPIEYSSAPILRKGQVIGAVIAFSDITDRINIENALKKANQSLELKVTERTEEISILHQAIEQTGNAVVITDDKANILYVNPAFTETTGYSYEEALGSNPRFLQSREQEKADYKEMWQTLTSGRTWKGHFINQKKNGALLREKATITPVKNVSGKIVRYIAVKDDVTKQIEIEKLLAESNQNYQRIVEGTNDLITYVDGQGNLQFVNPVAIEIFGLSPQECIGRSAFDFIHPEDQLSTLSWFQENIKNLRPHGTIENRQVSKHGDINHILWHVNFHYGKDGEIIGSDSIGSNITERINMEKRLVEIAEKADNANKSKSIFLANMSHEIRTPLNSVIGYTELMSRTDINDLQKSYLNSIQTSGNNLLHLINDILDFSKIEAGKIDIRPSEFLLNDSIKEVIGLFQEKMSSKNLLFHLDFDLDLSVFVVLDKPRLQQVLINLFSNAVKFTETGFIKLGIYLDPVDTKAHLQNLSIRVEDSGIGIPQDQQKTIFDAFEQQKNQSYNYGGTGLGLAICKNLIELMDGSIQLDSTPGEGSRFSIFFNKIPVRIGDHIVSKSHYEIEEDRVAFKSAKVLVVDDMENSRSLLKGFLKYHGLTPIEAENGETAVAQAFNHQPELILMDLKMPVMDGFQALRILKEDNATKHIPVIAVTADVFKPRDQEENLTFDGFLAKPVIFQQMTEELKKHLDITSTNQLPPVKDSANYQNTTTKRNNKQVLDDTEKENIDNLTDWMVAQEEQLNILQSAMYLDGIKEFAEQSLQKATEYQCFDLIQWSEEVLGLINRLQLDRLGKTLSRFTEITTNLKQILDEEH